jgi:hypothetical protein
LKTNGGTRAKSQQNRTSSECAVSRPAARKCAAFLLRGSEPCLSRAKPKELRQQRGKNSRNLESAWQHPSSSGHDFSRAATGGEPMRLQPLRDCFPGPPTHSLTPEDQGNLSRESLRQNTRLLGPGLPPRGLYRKGRACERGPEKYFPPPAAKARSGAPAIMETSQCPRGRRTAWRGGFGCRKLRQAHTNGDAWILSN